MSPAPSSAPNPLEVEVSDDAAFGRYLEQVRITGQVATPREANLEHITGFLEGVEHLEFGVRLTRPWSWEEVFEVMVQRCGLDPDLTHRSGQDTIGTAQCIAQLDAYGRAFGQALAQRRSILFATGHPAGLFVVYQAMAQAARAHDCEVLQIEEGIAFDGGDLRQINDVVMYQRYGALAHTHFSEPMRLVLDQLAEEGKAPGLVVADHGFAGTAASAGWETIGIADCNDPGLFVAQAQGQLGVCVPMDDNVLPHFYAPVVRRILDSAEPCSNLS